MTRIRKFLQFLNEGLDQDVKPVYVRPEPVAIDPEEVVNFHISEKLKKLISSMKDSYKVAELLSKLEGGVTRKYLAKDPVNYLDIDDEGNISFLKSRYFDESPDKWSSTRRVKMKATKVLKEIFNEQYINTNIKQTDIEAFVNKLASVKDTSCRVEEFRGMDSLRAYNYKKELSKNFGYSCANFHQAENSFGKYTEPKVSEFDIYTKNPEQCGVVVVWDNGVIMARRSFQQGIQVCDSKLWKKGEFHTVWGNYYGVSGKYDVMMLDYLRKKYPNAVVKQGGPNYSGLCISLETRFTYYCPFDSMYVNFEHNLLTDNPSSLPSPYCNYSWVNTYHAFCPKKYVKERLEEEKSHTPKIDIDPRKSSGSVNPKQPFKRPLTNEEYEALCHYFPHYTWAKNIDADGKLIMAQRSTMPPYDEKGSFYLTEEDLDKLTDKVPQPVVQLEPKVVVDQNTKISDEKDQLQPRIKPAENLDDWGEPMDKEDYHPTYYRDKMGRFRKKTS